MSATLSLNLAEFNRVLDLAAMHSERTYHEITNSAAADVARRAVLNTRKASAEKISMMLGQVATQISLSKRGKSAGKFKGRKQYSSRQSILLYRIVNARRIKAGQPPIFGDEMSRESRQVRAAILRSVGFVRSGWIWALKDLSTGGINARATDRIREQVYGKKKGYCKLALRSFSSMVTTEIGNSSLVNPGKFSHRNTSALSIAEDGLARAAAESTQDRIRHVKEKLGKALQPFGAIVT